MKHHAPIIALLAVLLLSSCEPAPSDASGLGTGPGDSDGETDDKTVFDRTHPERIAAQNSLGKPPLPRNFSNSTDGICPVHHEQMKVREIPIVFEDAQDGKADPFEMQAAAEFPFGAEKIVSSENALLPSEPVSARVFQCTACIAARRAAEARRTAAARQ